MKTCFVNSFPLRPECPSRLIPVSGTDYHSPSLLLKVLGLLSLQKLSFGPLFCLVNWLIGGRVVAGGAITTSLTKRGQRNVI